MTTHYRNSIGYNGPAHASGMTLLEVVLAIVIFVVGMLALASLQTNLTKSNTDANLRTVAASVAEETVEDLRGFQKIESEAGVRAYDDIEDSTSTVTRGNVQFTVDVDKTEYYFSAADGITVTSEDDLDPDDTPLKSDFTHVLVDVSWDAGQEFQIGDGTQTTGGLGSGNFQFSSIIPAIPSLNNAKVAAEDDGGLGYPPVDYTPGDLPDIVRITLDDTNKKFKESTTPLPDVKVGEELIESWFDVVTYSQNPNATFLRREEFLAVTCQCELKLPANGTGGLRPTYWTGDDYSNAEFVAKPYGISASNKNSFYCTTCCRDHHDNSSTAPEDRYDPFLASNKRFGNSDGDLDGDHKHYDLPKKAGDPLVLADDDGDKYLEACRMVRKDGFLRVAQDFRQEFLFAVPPDYLDDTTDLAVYSQYVTDTVEAFVDTNPINACTDAEGTCNEYDSSPPTWTAPATNFFPADDEATASVLTPATTQQLRSRGIYVDYMNKETREAITCLLQDGNTGEDCDLPGVTDILEVIPFFDVQLTFLSNWVTSPIDDPINVTNEVIEDHNAHSRGLASQVDSKTGDTTVTTKSHPGNLGLIGTEGAEPDYLTKLETYDMYMKIEGEDDGGGDDPVVSGSFTTTINGFKASSIVVSGNGDAACVKTSDVTFSCAITGASPRLLLSGLSKGQANYYACAVGLTPISTGPGSAEFILPISGATGIAITIQTGVCGS